MILKYIPKVCLQVNFCRLRNVFCEMLLVKRQALCCESFLTTASASPGRFPLELFPTLGIWVAKWGLVFEHPYVHPPVNFSYCETTYLVEAGLELLIFSLAYYHMQLWGNMWGCSELLCSQVACPRCSSILTCWAITPNGETCMVIFVCLVGFWR